MGSVPIIKMLLEEGKSPINATDNDGLTALHHAISEGHGDAAILLLKSGADAEKRDGDGRLAIDLVPDDKVCVFPSFIFVLMFRLLLLAGGILPAFLILYLLNTQVKQYILQTAEREGIELP